MLLIRLRHTSAFRSTVFATAAFVLAGTAVLGFLYWRMLSVIDRQIDGALARELADMTAAYDQGGYERLRRTVADRASPHEDSVRLYLLVGPGGAGVGNLSGWPERAPPPGAAADLAVAADRTPARIRTLAFADGSRLLVGRSLGERNNFRLLVEESAAGVMLINLVLGVAAGMAMARHSVRRLGEINKTAQEVLDGNLAGRVEAGGGGDEYDLLARTINAMLDRIQRLVGTVRGVTENIAHDLRTPLNRLRSRLELALMSPRAASEYEQTIQRAIAEADAIIATFNGMLKIARIEAGAASPLRDPVDLGEVVEELADLYRAFSEESGVAVEAEVEPGVTVLGDGHLISQAAANLLDNAIKYSPRGGRVTIAAARAFGGVRLEVADNGPGIPPEMRALVLDRFVRLDASRHKPGSGLGLSFVAAVAEWHGAHLSLSDNAPGLRAALLFPPGRREAGAR